MMRYYCPQKIGSYPCVPLSLGARVRVLGNLTYDDMSIGDQLLLFPDPVNYAYKPESLCRIQSIKSLGAENVYLARPSDLLRDDDRHRGIRSVCSMCKKACPAKPQPSRTPSQVAKERIVNYVLTRNHNFGKKINVESAIQQRMGSIGAKGGKTTTSARITSAKNASVIRWENYRRMRSDSPVIIRGETDVAQ